MKTFKFLNTEYEIHDNLRCRPVGATWKPLPIHASRMQALLGWPGKLPPHGFGPVQIGNTTVRINPPTPGASRAKHRVYATCPACSRDVPAGRLHQHIGTPTCIQAQYVNEANAKWG